MTETASTQPMRSAGAAYSARIDREKGHRAKSRSFRPLFNLWPFAARYPARLTLFLIFLAASTLMTLGLSFIVRGIADCGFGGANAPAYCNYFTADSGQYGGYFAFACAFAVSFAIISATRAYLINTLGERIVADIRAAVFDNLMRLSPSYFERVRTGEVLSRLTTDTTLVETVVTGSISFAIRSIATTIGALILMFIVSWKLTLMVIAIGPLIIIPAVIVGRMIQKLARDGQDTLASASARAGESLSGIQTVQAFTREHTEAAAFRKTIDATYAVQQKRLFIRGFLMVFILSAAMIGIIFILWFGAVSVQKGLLASGAIIQFAMLAFLVVTNTGMLSETWTNLLRAAGASERLSEILAEQPTIIAHEPAQTLDMPRGAIEFVGVNFAYPTRPSEPALKDISFAVKPGETVALVGPSGAGKSTVFQMLLRFYDPKTGSITIDGADIRGLDPQELRSHIAIVQQGTPLFSGSAFENIAYGRVGASEPDVKAAAAAAFASEFIEKLPGGYEGDLGERGGALSGGQQQRIAIARAILRDAPVLLLDEATSALDAESEHAVQTAFTSLAKGRTTLVIAHRLATVKSVDRIIVMDEGKILATGSHEELIARGGLYARLADLQFSR